MGSCRARHGLLGSCCNERPPGFKIPKASVAAPQHRHVQAPESLKIRNGKVFCKNHGTSYYLQARGAGYGRSSFRILASTSVNKSTDSNRPSENQENHTEATADTESSSNSTVTTSNKGQLADASDTNSINDVGSSSAPSWVTTEPFKADEQNEKKVLPESLADEMKKSGPLKDIQNHIAGNISSSPSSASEAALSHLLASHNVFEFMSRFPSWADAQKESGMPRRQKRSFYSHDDWLQHRSSLRYIRHMVSSVSSRVIVSLVPSVFASTTVAIFVAAYNIALKYGYLPWFLPKLHAASLPYALTAPALALLLVFRTDASYSRFNEARKTWTSIISSTKDLARLSAQLIRNPEDGELKSSLLSYILAFPVSLKCHLVHGSNTLSELERLLEPYDLAFVLSSEHRPNCLIQLISQALILLHLEDTDRVLLENHVQLYVASVDVCERLSYTPIPISYTRLTSRFLVLWHMTLPVVLWDVCDWLVIPATFFSAATLFCIEEVGVLIEEPFPMLALDKVIGLGHDSIQELLKRQQDTDHFLSLKRKQPSK